MNRYYDDMMAISFDAKVSECQKVDSMYHIILEETAFYPEKGGMAKDTGKLQGLPVLDVIEHEGNIIHVVSSPLKKGITVHGEVDFDQRLRKCQIHTAQHIISYYLESRFPCMTVSHHVSHEEADIVLDWQEGEISIDPKQLIHEINAYANNMIRKAVPVNICYPDYEEFRYRQKKTSFTKGDEVRVVKLGDEDYNFCGCIHVPNISYIQMIHVHAVDCLKTGWRIHYQAGEALRDNLDYRIRIMKEASMIMKFNEIDLIRGIETLHHQKEELEHALQEARQRNLDMVFASLLERNEDIITEKLEGLTVKEGQILASRLTAQEKIVYLLIKMGDQCHVIMASPKGSRHNMKEDYDRFASQLMFRGGGNAFMAQGGGPYDAECFDLLCALAQERKQYGR